MMRAMVVILAVVACAPAAAAPVTLTCIGELNAGGKTIPISNETAVLDFDSAEFKPPLYGAFPLANIRETEVSFGRESQTLSVWGSLDRISGSLTMTVLEPRERAKLKAGGSANFLAWMSAKCAPAKKMF